VVAQETGYCAAIGDEARCAEAGARISTRATAAAAASGFGGGSAVAAPASVANAVVVVVLDEEQQPPEPDRAAAVAKKRRHISLLCVFVSECLRNKVGAAAARRSWLGGARAARADRDPEGRGRRAEGS